MEMTMLKGESRRARMTIRFRWNQLVGGHHLVISVMALIFNKCALCEGYHYEVFPWRMLYSDVLFFLFEYLLVVIPLLLLLYR